MRRMGRRVISFLAAAVLGLAGLLVDPDRAWACECTGISTATALDRSDAAFLGKVIAADAVGRRGDRRTDLRFEVSRVYRGTVYAEQVVASPVDVTACGLRPEIGSSWVIFAVDSVEGDDDDTVYRLRTTTCSGNLPTSTAPAELGRGRNPLPGPSDREESSISTDAAITRVLVVGGVGVLGLAALAGVALLLIWRPRPGR